MIKEQSVDDNASCFPYAGITIFSPFWKHSPGGGNILASLNFEN
jgi:hypothetical protein